jgi:hypothetical protein
MQSLRLRWVRPQLLILVGLALAPAMAEGQVWQAGRCDKAVEPELMAFEQAVRAAKPGSTMYVPKPFPTTAAAVMLDARYAYQRIYRDPMKMPQFEKRFYAWMASSQYTYRVDRVVNWNPSRCSRGDRGLTYFLVTLRDLGQGQPIGRMALDEAGLLMTWAPNPVLDLPLLVEVVNRAINDFKVAPSNAHFVAAWGDLNCEPLDPCLAFEADGRNHVLARTGLYAFHVGTRLPVSEASAIRNFASYHDAKAKLAADEALVSLGTEGWAVARKVVPPAG